MSNNNLTCPLCMNDKVIPYAEDKRREYFQCELCKLVFVAPKQYLSVSAEKAIYDLHQNSEADVAYRQFLSRLFIPLNKKIEPGSSGLDFGCGPGPALARMFEEQGHSMALYDIFYFDNKSELDQQYDFITATEVVEHLHNPGYIINTLWSILRPGGFFGIMTKLLIGKDEFQSWHYKNDMTHVCFFSEDTLVRLAHTLEAEVEFVGSDVVILKKPGICNAN